MVTGPRFCYGHIPRTGGDAAHAYLAAIPGLAEHVDSPADPRKHDTFAERGVVREHYLLSVRPLPDWSLSVLTEAPHHPWLMARHGWRTAADARRPGNALALDADDLIRRFTAGVTIHHWLWMPRLLDDVVWYAASVGVPADRESLARLATKPATTWDAAGFFGPGIVRELYARNPLWAAAERAALRRCPAGLP